MGWYYIPEPSEPIEHTKSYKNARTKAEVELDDIFLREQWAKDAAKICCLCGEPIGYGSKVYSSDTVKDGLEHTLCVWKRAEEKKGKA